MNRIRLRLRIHGKDRFLKLAAVLGVLDIIFALVALAQVTHWRPDFRLPDPNAAHLPMMSVAWSGPSWGPTMADGVAEVMSSSQRDEEVEAPVSATNRLAELQKAFDGAGETREFAAERVGVQIRLLGKKPKRSVRLMEMERVKEASEMAAEQLHAEGKDAGVGFKRVSYVEKSIKQFTGAVRTPLDFEQSMFLGAHDDNGLLASIPARDALYMVLAEDARRAIAVINPAAAESPALQDAIVAQLNRLMAKRSESGGEKFRKKTELIARETLRDFPLESLAAERTEILAFLDIPGWTSSEDSDMSIKLSPDGEIVIEIKGQYVSREGLAAEMKAKLKGSLEGGKLTAKGTYTLVQQVETGATVTEKGRLRLTGKRLQDGTNKGDIMLRPTQPAGASRKLRWFDVDYSGPV